MKGSSWLWLVAVVVLGTSGCVIETTDCTDTDGDLVCDEDEVYGNCIDDFTLEYICASCTAADNICSDPWALNYCAGGVWYNADCNASCTGDPAVYGQTCAGTPAVAGECDDGMGVCVCWCEDAFDSCINDWQVQYTRDGVTYTVDCKEYCNGTCDAGAGACAC